MRKNLLSMTAVAAMLALPPVPPIVGWRKQARLGLPQPLAVEQNGTHTASLTAGRQRFSGVECDHSLRV